MSDFQSNIVRLKTYPGMGLYHWRLFGLNIFESNEVPCAIEQRPDVVFLTDMTSRLDCAAHVSSLALKDRAASPEQMFGLPFGPTPYLRSRIGFHDIFYDLNEWHSWDSCVFPQVTPLFWQALFRKEGDLSEMIGSHGFAFYVAPYSSTTVDLENLLSSPFSSQTEWLKTVCELHALVVTVGHDGQYFHIYSRDEASLALLEPSLHVAVNAVQTSAWFQWHRDELAWDDEWLCLMLPG